MPRMSQYGWIVTLAALAAAGGCMFKPAGSTEAAGELKKQGQPYQEPFEKRQLPELPSPATWHDVLQRALVANGEVEAAYHEWHAALEEVDVASYWPNSNVSLNFSYMFGPGNTKSWDRTTVGAGFDPAAPLLAIPKVKKGGEIALESARQSAEVFRSAKFRVQRQALEAYYDLALMEEQIRIEQSDLELSRTLLGNARSRVQAGGPQQDLLKAQLQVRTTENSVADMQSQANAMRAMLNGMMGRKPEAPIVLPAELPAARPIPAADDRLIAAGVAQNPELARLASQVKGRQDAIELAKLKFIPDISPTGSFTGSASQTLGAMVTLPTAIPMINASIREAKAMREASEAMLRQTKQEKGASFVATLYALRNARRQEAFLAERILPMSRQVLASSRQDYIDGRVQLVELLEAQRMLLDVRRSVALARVDGEKRLAELEELAGVDVEMLASPSTQPTTGVGKSRMQKTESRNEATNNQ